MQTKGSMRVNHEQQAPVEAGVCNAKAHKRTKWAGEVNDDDDENLQPNVK